MLMIIEAPTVSQPRQSQRTYHTTQVPQNPDTRPRTGQVRHGLEGEDGPLRAVEDASSLELKSLPYFPIPQIPGKANTPRVIPE